MPELDAQIGQRPAEYLERLVGRVAESLGGRLTAVWLIGSAAMGDFEPGSSDLDVAVIVTEPLSESDRERLAAGLSHQALPCPARKLELVVYRAGALSGPTLGAFDLNLNTGQGIATTVDTDPNGVARHWFVLDLAIAREGGRALVGPEPAALIAPVPRPVVLEALAESLDWHTRQESASTGAVLAACRAWHFVDTGRWSSKGQAAHWARARLEAPELVDRALAIRTGRGHGALDHAQVAAFVGRIAGLVAQERARLSCPP